MILFEGRDAAGKGGTIKRFMEHLNPRAARVVALTKPTETERGQWYFHRYVTQLPTAGEIVLFDRSWYNRAGVERVMGFCTDRDYEIFLRQAPLFEEMLVESGFSLTKLWFSVTQSEQRTRFAIRQIDPVRRWKLSPMDIESLDRWDAYTAAKEAMIEHTDTDYAPWTSIKSNDKKRGPHQRDAVLPQPVRLRGQGPDCGPYCRFKGWSGGATESATEAGPLSGFAEAGNRIPWPRPTGRRQPRPSAYGRRAVQRRPPR